MPSFAFLQKIIHKTKTFQLFTGLTVKEFDEIYNKEVAKRYEKHEIKRLSKRKNRERSIGAGRHFKLDPRDRFLMLLV